jgi:hypothetical protein
LASRYTYLIFNSKSRLLPKANLYLITILLIIMGKYETRHFIDGKFVDGESGKTFDVRVRLHTILSP